jgi:hypothetical protein
VCDCRRLLVLERANRGEAVRELERGGIANASNRSRSLLPPSPALFSIPGEWFEEDASGEVEMNRAMGTQMDIHEQARCQVQTAD